MKRLVIVGAGGYGREVASAASACAGYGRAFVLKGFLDRNSRALGDLPGYPPVLGAPETYAVQPDDVFFVAMGSVALRRQNAALLAARGGRFLSLVHETASLGRNVSLGEGCYVAHHAVLADDVRLGAQDSVFHGVVIDAGVRVGTCSHVSPLVSLGAGVRLGNDVTLHPGVLVAPGVSVGDAATVGIGSVVLDDVRAAVTVFGNPAREMPGFLIKGEQNG